MPEKASFLSESKLKIVDTTNVIQSNLNPKVEDRI